MKIFKTSLVLILGLGFAVSAGAVTITATYSDNGNGTETWTLNNVDAHDNPDATVTCPLGACNFLIADDLPNSNPETELALLNTVVEPDVPGSACQTSSGACTGGASGSSDSWTITSQYFMFKFGDIIDAWFQNLLYPSAIDPLSVTTGKGAGLSHVTTVPAPGILALLGLGLAGLGVLRRRVRK